MPQRASILGIGLGVIAPGEKAWVGGSMGALHWKSLQKWLGPKAEWEEGKAPGSSSSGVLSHHGSPERTKQLISKALVG
jgi:hypothetical protein